MLWVESLFALADPISARPWVEQKARGPVTVVNSKSLPAAVRGNGAVAIPPEQIDPIARQLDAFCRDLPG